MGAGSGTNQGSDQGGNYGGGTGTGAGSGTSGDAMGGTDSGTDTSVDDQNAGQGDEARPQKRRRSFWDRITGRNKHLDEDRSQRGGSDAESH